MSESIRFFHHLVHSRASTALAVALLGWSVAVACGPESGQGQGQGRSPAEDPTGAGSGGLDQPAGQEIASAGADAEPGGGLEVDAVDRVGVPEIPTGPALGLPEVSVVREAVALNPVGGGGARDLPVEVSAELELGAAIEVGPVGTAMVRWPEGLRAEVLSGTEIALEPAPTGLRQALVVQDGGTARYSLPALPEPAALSVRTPAGGVLAVGGPADVIVGIRPEGEDTASDDLVWIIVVHGEVSVTADGAVASADTSSALAPGASAALQTGQAVVIGPEGGIEPLVLPIDVVSVETWYGQLLSGYADTPIADAAFRCRISSAGAVLHDVPAVAGRRARAAAGAGMPLSEGALVDAKARTADGLWIKAVAADTQSVGWLRAAELTCIAPVAGLPEADALAMAPATPTPAFAPVPAAVSFTADVLQITPGECVTLRWDVPVGGDVAFDGKTVPGKGWQRACPEATRDYVLRWIEPSGRRQERTITVRVDSEPSAVEAALQVQSPGSGSGSGSGSGAPGGGGAGAPPTPTLCPEDCIVEMPTLAPTPTIPPRPTRAPTLVPEPTSPPPTAAPEPTEPPPPPPAEPTAPPAEPTEPPSEPTEPPAEPTATATPTPTATPEATETEPPAEPSQTPTPVPSPTPGSGSEAGVST